MKNKQRIKEYTFSDFSNTNLKELNYKDLTYFSSSIRKYIIEKCSINGGHLASNLGVIELTVALHRNFDLNKDKLLFDVGHQCYTHKILTGRSLDNLRKENGTDGFQKRNESKYDHFEAGHSSTSISSAMGMAINRDLHNEDYEIVSVIGDASIANGLAIEALNNMSDFKHKIIIVINDNDMSISQPVGAFHNMFQSIRLSNKYLKMKEKYRKFMQKNRVLQGFYSFSRVLKNSFKSVVLKNNIFELFGFRYIGNVDGYDFKELDEAFKKAKKMKNSVVIHVSTIKGKGYNLIKKDNVSKWHSVKPFNIQTGEPLTKIDDNKTNFYNVYASLLDEELKNNPYSILINPSTTIGSGIDYLFKKYPNQTFDVGICEEHALTFASGYALTNNHAYVSIYSSFLQRGYDQLNHDIARIDLPVTLLIDRCGLVGSDGETHQGIFDESFIMNLPNFSVAMAKNACEARGLFKFASNFNHPLAIRIINCNTLKSNDTDEIIYGKWKIEKESYNKKLCVISFGPKIIDILNKSKDLDFTLINAIFQKPFDEQLLKSILDYENILIYDPYAIKEGFTYHLLIKLDELNYKGNKHFISLNSEFIQKGTVLEQEKRCHVDLDTLFNKINSLL